MDLGISGKVAMVAAGSKGIGFAIAKLLTEEGCSVSICGRSQVSLDAAVSTLGANAKGYVCDVSKGEDLERWLESTKRDLGSPDILVTNTGGPPAGPIGKMSDAQWQDGFESTLLNVVRLYRLVAPLMQEKGWGRIVHITSLVAKEPSDLLPISSTLRAGIAAMTRLQSNELAKHGITVNAVLPGHTLTDRQLHLAEVIAERDGISKEEALERQGKQNPTGRIASADEVGAAAVFLCSQQAAFINGVNLLVDGGSTKGIA